MLPILVSVFATLPVFKPPGDFEPEWLVPADPSFTGGANYVILNLIDGKRYEGETVNFKKRYGKHLHNMKNKNAKGHNYHRYRAMRKHGIENFRFYFRRTFKFEGREKLNPTEKKAFNKKFKDECLYPCETYWILRLGLMDDSKGYNKMETGKGGAGRVWTDEQKAKLSAALMGIGAKPVTRCEILEDGETHQKVRLTRYESTIAAEAANPGAHHGMISGCCLKRKRYKSAGGYLWWHCKENDIYDEDITVEWVGDVPRVCVKSAIISKLKLANGDYLEQWHDSMHEGGRTLSTANKKVSFKHISACCNGRRKRHQGYEFRRVTTEKRKDFDKDGKRIVNTKKRKRN